MDKKTLEGLKVRMSPPVIMLVVALLIAGIVSYWSYGLLQKKTVEQAAPADTQQVAVAAYDLKWGTVITSEVVKTQPYLKGSLPTGYIADPAAAVGRVVMYPMQVNEPFTESRLAPASVKLGGVAAIVSPKKRAMAVKVDKVVGVSGFIHPGHRVDVLVSLAKTDKVQQPDHQDRAGEHPCPRRGHGNRAGGGPEGKTGPGRCDHPGGDPGGRREACPFGHGGETPACPSQLHRHRGCADPWHDDPEPPGILFGCRPGKESYRRAACRPCGTERVHGGIDQGQQGQRSEIFNRGGE